VPSGNDCVLSLEGLVDDFQYTDSKWDEAGETGDYEAAIFNTTRLISGTFASSIGDCASSVFEAIVYTENQLALFDGINDWLTAFLQNLIGNIITFNSIYQSIVTAQESQDYETLYYYIGRIFFLIIDFGPLEESTLISQKLALELALQSKLLQEPSFWEIVYYAGYEFMDASIGTSSPNSTLCTNNITALIDLGRLIDIQFNAYIYDEAVVTIRQMLQKVDPITFSCYYTLFEFWEILLDYVGTVQDPIKIAYNLIYHMPFLFDDAVELVNRFQNPTEDIQHYKRLGFLFGDLINRVFFKPTDYEPYNPNSILLN